MRQIPSIVFLFIVFAVSGQDHGSPAGEVEDQQVIIEKDKPLTLPRANRIYQRTEIRSIEQETSEMNYQISQPSYDFDPYFPNFSIKSYEPVADRNGDYTNYIKAGYGNFGSPLVQGYFGVDYEGNSAGAWINHESFAKGPVREEESAYSLSEILLDGTLSTNNISFSPELYYQREGYYFYGYDAEALGGADNVNLITDRIAANHFSLGADLQTWENEKFQLTLNPSYTYTNMKEQGEESFNVEHMATLKGNFEVHFNERFGGGLNAEYTYFNYRSGLDQVRNLVGVNPYLTFENDVLLLKGGFSYYAGTDSLSSGTQSYLYPDLEAKLQLSDNFGLFAGLSGGLKATALNGLRLDNRYLQDSLPLFNQSVKLDFQGGIETNLAEKLLLRGFVMFRQIDNRPLFFHSSSDSSRFSVLYDPENFTELGIGAEGRYYLGNQTAFSANLTLLGYETDTVSEAWYLPALRFDLIASHSINDALKLRTHLILLEGIKAPDPVTFGAIDMNTIINLSIGAQYNFIPSAGVFAEFENLLSQNYERYLNYPARGFMAKLGFIYRF